MVAKTYHWTIVAQISFPFLWFHFHSVNLHRVPVFDANFGCQIAECVVNAPRTNHKWEKRSTTTRNALNRAQSTNKITTSQIKNSVFYTIKLVKSLGCSKTARRNSWRTANRTEPTVLDWMSMPITIVACFPPVDSSASTNRVARRSYDKWRGGSLDRAVRNYTFLSHTLSNRFPLHTMWITRGGFLILRRWDIGVSLGFMDDILWSEVHPNHNKHGIFYGKLYIYTKRFI